MAVSNLHCSTRFILSQVIRSARISQQVIYKSTYTAPSKPYNRVSASLPLNTVHQNTHSQQLYSPHFSAVQLSRSTTQVHCRTLHTSSACCLTVTSSLLLSSRRGKLSNLDDAKQYISSLTVIQRTTLERALQEVRADLDETDNPIEDIEKNAPSRNQLKLLCYQSALPFIGFGFLDNVIMITVGEYIDWTLGLTLGISTMAAAGLGNMISDLAGLGLADQVEAFCLRLGIPNPKLSSSQLKHKSSRWAILLGRCIGIAIGCTIGMAPLYWIDNPHKQCD